MEARRLWYAVLGLLLLGTVVRLTHLDARGLWLDEVTSIQVSSESVSTIVTGGAHDDHTPPFYYLLLHSWWSVAPQTEAGLRLLSVVVDLANVLLMLWVFGRQFGRRVGWVSALIYALAEFGVYYAQEGRMYSLTVFFSLASYGLLLIFRDGRDTWREWAALVIVTACGLYTHYYFAFLLAAMTVAMVAEGGLRAPARRWCTAMIGAGLIFVPWLPTIFGLLGQGGQSFRRFVLSVPPYAFFRFVAGYAVFPLNYGSKDDLVTSVLGHLPSVLAYFLVFGALAVVGLYRLITTHRGEAVFLLAPMLLPGIAGLLISLRAPMLSERYLVVSYPFLVALLTLAVTSPTKSKLLRTVRAAGLALMWWALLLHYVSPEFGNTQWRESVRYVVEAGRSPDRIYAHPYWTHDVVEVYAGRGIAVVPVSNEVRQSLSDPTAHRPRQLWLLERGSHPSLRPELEASGYRLRDERLFPLRNGVRVLHLELVRTSDIDESPVS